MKPIYFMTNTKNALNSYKRFTKKLSTPQCKLTGLFRIVFIVIGEYLQVYVYNKRLVCSVFFYISSSL